MAMILVVEDDKDLSEAYVMILQKEGYKVQSVHDGQSAITTAKRINPDLILLDLRMPGMGGVEFLKHYDVIKEHKDVKVLVFSNLDSGKEVEQAFELGASRYILKAWASPLELVRLVSEMLEEE